MSGVAAAYDGRSTAVVASRFGDWCRGVLGAYQVSMLSVQCNSAAPRMLRSCVHYKSGRKVPQILPALATSCEQSFGVCQSGAFA